MKSTKKLFAILTLVVFMMTLLPMSAFAAATVTASASTSIVNDGSKVSLAGNIVLAEGAIGDLGVGNIVITAPTGISFDTATTPNAAITTADAGGTFAVGAVVVTSSTITIPVTTASTGATGATLTIGSVTKPKVLSTANVGTYNLSVNWVGGTATNCAPIVVSATSNRFSSLVSTDKTSLLADGTETVKFTVYGFDQYNNTVTAPVITVASDRGITDTFSAVAGSTPAVSANDARVLKVTGSAGKAEFKVSSSVVGTANISIAILDNTVGTSVADYANGVTAATAAVVGVVKTTAITFTAGSTDAIAINGTPTTNDATDVVGGTGLTSAAAYNLTTGTMLANGVEYYELAFKVTSSGVPVANETVTWSVNDVQVGLNKTSATTDAAGIAKVKVTSTKPGTFAVRADAAGKTKTYYVKYSSSGTYDLSLVAGGNETVARDQDYTIKFKLVDASGNRISVPAGAFNVTTANGTYGISFSATTRPADVAMVEDITAAGGAVNYVCDADTDGNLKFTMKAAVLNKAGSYVVKAYLTNGKSVSVPFTVAKQGDVTRIELSYPTTNIALGATSGYATVKYYDAANVMKKVEGTVAATEFTGLVTFSATPAYRTGAITAGNGQFTATATKDDAGLVTITAIDVVNNLTASTQITINKGVSHFIATAPAAATAPGSSAEVAIQFVDKDGNNIGLGKAFAPANTNNYVISKPSGAIVSVSAEGSFASKIQDSGAAVIKVNSNKAGDVKVQFVVTFGADTYTGDATVAFAEPVVKTVVGAKAVTMFIGATGFVQDGTAKVNDVAPFIQDGRTFVAVRPIADAFGAEIGWNAATQTVTLTRTDMTLTIVIGSNTITKVAGGVTSTSTADVPAFIKDGRTVLPFRAVGEAFGATVSYDAATQAVSFMQ